MEISSHLLMNGSIQAVLTLTTEMGKIEKNSLRGNKSNGSKGRKLFSKCILDV